MKRNLAFLLLSFGLLSCSPKNQVEDKNEEKKTTSNKEAAPKTSKSFPLSIVSVTLERANPSIPGNVPVTFELAKTGGDWDAKMEKLFDETTVNGAVSLRTFVGLLHGAIKGNEADKASFKKIEEMKLNKPQPTGATIEALTFYGPNGKLFSTRLNGYDYSGNHLVKLRDRVKAEGKKTENAP